MQPLIAADHESRHNSSRTEEVHETVETESTPLISRFSLNNNPTNPRTKILASFLAIVLIVGTIIGIYLLIIQNNSENVVPPVDVPLLLVSRLQWDRSKSSSSPAPLLLPLYRQKQVVVVQTGTDQCFSTDSCTALLQEMQANATATNGFLPYNFLISSNGQTYEALGWYRSSPFNHAQYSTSGLVLAFIGNFEQVAPTKSQMEEAKNFFAESVSRQHLDVSYSIVGKSVNGSPRYLFENFKSFPRWNGNLSDAL